MSRILNQATHLNADEIRQQGAYYTNEENILKVINPLFLEDLKDEFEAAKDDLEKLHKLHDKISSLKFLDPACGGGNFLLVTYICLLELENKIMMRLKDQNEKIYSKVSARQFYGIEIDKSAVCQALRSFEKLTAGKSMPKILTANALQTDWNQVVSKKELNFIIGNPPFIGAYSKTAEQKQDMERVFGKKTKHGLLDYACAWMKKSAEFMENTKIETAFIITDSVTQGQQPAILWQSLAEYGAEINFAYRSFKWTD